MEQPTKAKMHSAIDRSKMDGKYPMIFIAFDEEGRSENTSFFYGDRNQLIPLIYDVFGKVLFDPPQAMPMPTPGQLRELMDEMVKEDLTQN